MLLSTSLGMTLLSHLILWTGDCHLHSLPHIFLSSSSHHQFDVISYFHFSAQPMQHLIFVQFTSFLQQRSFRGVCTASLSLHIYIHGFIDINSAHTSTVRQRSANDWHCQWFYNRPYFNSCSNIPAASSTTRKRNGQITFFTLPHTKREWTHGDRCVGFHH